MTDRIFSAVCIVTFLISCKNSPEKLVQPEYPIAKDFSIKESETVKYELDSITAPYSACIQFLEAKDSSKSDTLAYLNEETGTLYFNSVANKRIISSLTPKLPSPELKKAFQGFYYHNHDSIFFFTFGSKVLLINGAGDVLKNYDLKQKRGEESGITYSGINIETKVMPFFVDGKLFISSYVVGNLKSKEIRKNCVVIDTRSWDASLANSYYPENYYDDFGGLHYYLYYTAYNPYKKLAVYSYPAVNNLITYSPKSGREEKVNYQGNDRYTVSTYKEAKFKDAPSGPVGEYFMQTNSFGPILFDRFRNLYYRFVLLPARQKNAVYEAKDAPTKPIVIIVLDENFRFLGEQKLDRDSFWPNTCFVSKEGLNIQNRTKSDSTLDFSIFKIEKL